MCYSKYYQAVVQKEKTWFFTAALRSYEDLAFERTFDPSTATFEFFVSPDYQQDFLDFISYFKEVGIVSQFVELPNRFQNFHEQL